MFPAPDKNNVTFLLRVELHCKFPMVMQSHAYDNGGRNLQARKKLSFKLSQKLKRSKGERASTQAVTLTLVARSTYQVLRPLRWLEVVGSTTKPLA